MSIRTSCFIPSIRPTPQNALAQWRGWKWELGTSRLSGQVPHEFYWNAPKEMHARPIAARGIVEDLSHWRPVEMDAAQLSYWDALIVAAAQIRFSAIN